MKELTSVPASRVRTPYSAPLGAVTPLCLTVGAGCPGISEYRWPSVQMWPVKKLRPLKITAGQALTTMTAVRTTRKRTGTKAAPVQKILSTRSPQ